MYSTDQHIAISGGTVAGKELSFNPRCWFSICWC